MPGSKTEYLEITAYTISNVIYKCMSERKLKRKMNK